MDFGVCWLAHHPRVLHIPTVQSISRIFSLHRSEDVISFWHNMNCSFRRKYIKVVFVFNQIYLQTEMWHMYTGFRYIDSVSLLHQKQPQIKKYKKAVFVKATGQ